MRKFLPIAIAATALLLVSSCGGAKNTPAKPANPVIGHETVNVVMPTSKDIVHPVHGKEVWFGLGAMMGAGKYKANGVAQSHVFADGATIVTVNLNIKPAPKGYHLVAWVNKTGDTQNVRLDRLLNPLGDVRHLITVDVAKDLRTYTNVLVTLESDKAGAKSSDPVEAKGVLKEKIR